MDLRGGTISLIVGRQNGAVKLGPVFWRLWTSTASSNLGDGIGKTGFPLLAVLLTRDPVQVSLLTAAFFLPWLVFALPSGAIIDRVDRSRAMTLANAGRALVVGSLAMAVVTGVVALPMLYLAALFLGFAETIADGAYRAILPSIVEKVQLDRGNATLQGTELVADAFLGAPIASASFALAPAAPFVLGAVGFGISATVAATLPPTPATDGPTTPLRLGALRSEMAEGVRFLAGHRILRGLLLIGGVGALANSGFTAIAVLWALEVLGVPEALFGVLILSLAFGGVVGTLTVGALTARVGRANALRLAVGTMAVSSLAMAFVTNALIAAVLWSLASWAVIVWNVLTMSLRQQLIPEALFGRVQGAWRTVVYGTIPLGSVIGGVVAATFGLTAPLVVLGVVQGLLLVVGWRLMGRAAS
jgi:MFS family permease